MLTSCPPSDHLTLKSLCMFVKPVEDLTEIFGRDKDHLAVFHRFEWFARRGRAAS